MHLFIGHLGLPGLKCAPARRGHLFGGILVAGTAAIALAFQLQWDAIDTQALVRLFALLTHRRIAHAAAALSLALLALLVLLSFLLGLLLRLFAAAAVKLFDSICKVFESIGTALPRLLQAIGALAHLFGQLRVILLDARRGIAQLVGKVAAGSGRKLVGLVGKFAQVLCCCLRVALVERIGSGTCGALVAQRIGQGRRRLLVEAATRRLLLYQLLVGLPVASLWLPGLLLLW